MVKLYEAWGYTATLTEWAKMFGVETDTLRKRIAKGLTLEDALSLRPYQQTGSRVWTHDGETHGSREWAEILGLTQSGFLERVRAGFPDEKLFSPVDLRVKRHIKAPTRRAKRKDGPYVTILYSNELGVKPSVATIKAENIGQWRGRYKYIKITTKRP